MNRPKFVIYIRVSTRKQGDSGLGLEAQRKMCMDIIEREGGECVKEFQDVESGKSRTRPGLWGAIDFCRESGTPTEPCTLVVAKLDRLARDVEFTFKVINSGIQIRFADMPVMNTMLLGVFASVAQYERELIAGRTKAALDAIRDDIAENGGHMSKAGRWIKTIGGQKGQDTTAAAMSAGQTHAQKARDWRSDSALYDWVETQVMKGRPRKDILAEARALYEKNPKKWGTRKGCALCEGTLSRWVKEMQCGI